MTWFVAGSEQVIDGLQPYHSASVAPWPRLNRGQATRVATDIRPVDPGSWG